MTQELNPALVERMVALLRDLHADHIQHDMRYYGQDFVARTAAIVAELPKPVDPDLEEAREIAAQTAEVMGYPDHAARYRSGYWDHVPAVQSTLTAIKRYKPRATSGGSDE